jgi:hypothetical protein
MSQLYQKLFATLATAFFGADFDQAFCEEDQPGHLYPFGEDIANDLASFALSNHPHKQERPANLCDHDEHQKRVPMQKVKPPESRGAVKNGAQTPFEPILS